MPRNDAEEQSPFNNDGPSNKPPTREIEGDVIDRNEESAGAIMSAQTRAEVDIQISTAKRFPRSLARFRRSAMEMVTIDEETAAGCFYALPKRKGGDKAIQGPSIRMAEIVAACWGNLRIEARQVADDGKMIECEGMTWDLESNVAVRVGMKRRVVDKYGKRYSDDMVINTMNACNSIALRNSVFKVVPMVFTRELFNKAKEVAIGTAETLGSKRSKMVEYFGKMGITPIQVCGAVDKAGVEEIGLEELGQLKGFATAIRDGEATIEEVFEKERSVTDLKPGRNAVRGEDAKKPETSATPKKETTKPAATSAEDEDATAAALDDEKPKPKKEDAPKTEAKVDPPADPKKTTKTVAEQIKGLNKAGALKLQVFIDSCREMTECDPEEATRAVVNWLGTLGLEVDDLVEGKHRTTTQEALEAVQWSSHLP